MFLDDTFTITVEIVPPEGADPTSLLHQLETLHSLPISAFNVATNPVAKPRMSALSLCSLIQEQIGRPAVLHCTTRDHNRLSTQSLLWGAKALGIETILATTGDYLSLTQELKSTAVHDLNVFELVDMSRRSGLTTGVVYDPFSSPAGKNTSLDRLRKKIHSGAEFVITQPVYDREGVEQIAATAEQVDIPFLPGILPLRSSRHAVFLHEKVSGIVITEPVLERMRTTLTPIKEGITLSREILSLVRSHFPGVCLMPPFNDYSILEEILTVI